MDTWLFGPPIDRIERTMPSRRQQLLLNGIPVGEIEVHAHRRKGKDHVTDLSWGVTAITYGPLSLTGDLGIPPRVAVNPTPENPQEMSPLLQPPD